MRLLILYAVIIILSLACQDAPDKTAVKDITQKEIEKDSIETKIDSLTYFKQDTLKRKKEAKPRPVPIEHWTDLQFYKAVAYGVTKQENGDVFGFRDRSFAYELDDREAMEFLQFLKDTTSYVAGRQASCFNPNMGVVFYNVESEIQAYVEICLSCNNMYAKPELVNSNPTSYASGGLSLEVRKQLKKYCEKWGMPRCPDKPSSYDFKDPSKHWELNGD